MEQNFQRRSVRIAREIELVLRPQEGGQRAKPHAAKTLLLSRHGCILSCPTWATPDRNVQVRDPQRGKECAARIVYRELIGAERVNLALEFTDCDDFWEMNFPPPGKQ